MPRISVEIALMRPGTRGASMRPRRKCLGYHIRVLHLDAEAVSFNEAEA